MANDVYDYYYENYLMLYSMYGRGRPRLSRERYEELDRELLELAGASPSETKKFTMLTFNRIRDIEFLLLDDLSEALMDKTAEEEHEDEDEGESPSLEFTWSDDVGSHTP